MCRSPNGVFVWFIKLKNYTHVKKVGNTSEFILAFVDESDKQLFTKKTVELG